MKFAKLSDVNPPVLVAWVRAYYGFSLCKRKISANVLGLGATVTSLWLKFVEDFHIGPWRQWVRVNKLIEILRPPYVYMIIGLGL